MERVGGKGVLFAALGSSLVLECGTRSLQDDMEAGAPPWISQMSVCFLGNQFWLALLSDPEWCI